MRRRATPPVVQGQSEPFRTIVADPGWPYGDKLPGKKRGAKKNYKTMPVHEIARYLGSYPMIHELSEHLAPGYRLDQFIAKDARLFLWRVAPMQEEALHVMRAWGFGAPVSECDWLKLSLEDQELIERKLGKHVLAAINKHGDEQVAAWRILADARRLEFGMGRTFRMSHETCLVGRRGRPKRLSGSVRSAFFAPIREHSEKPEEFFELVERISPGPYLELFSGGHRRPGWTCLGESHREPVQDVAT